MTKPESPSACLNKGETSVRELASDSIDCLHGSFHSKPTYWKASRVFLFIGYFIMQCVPHAPGLVFEINLQFILTANRTADRRKIRVQWERRDSFVRVTEMGYDAVVL